MNTKFEKRFKAGEGGEQGIQPNDALFSVEYLFY